MVHRVSKQAQHWRGCSSFAMAFRPSVSKDTPRGFGKEEGWSKAPLTNRYIRARHSCSKKDAPRSQNRFGIAKRAPKVGTGRAHSSGAHENADTNAEAVVRARNPPSRS